MLKFSSAKKAEVYVSPTDRRGYPRSPVTFPTYRAGQAPANKGHRYPAEPLSASEVVALVAQCRPTPTGQRDAALIVLLWRTGLRVAEALALLPKDIDLEHGRVAVLHGKGDKRRVVALDYGACRMIERWTTLRAELGFDHSSPVFCVVQGRSKGLTLHSSCVREMLKDRAREAGIEKRVHPHGLRHTYAAYLMDQGVPIHHIRRMLGHTSIAITEKYADHLNPAAVLEEMRALEWPHAALLQSSQSELTA